MLHYSTAVVAADPRVDAFVANWAGGPAPDRATLAPALAAFVDRARAERPVVTLADAELVGFLAARIDRDADPVIAAAQVRAGDLALAAACAVGAPDALARFEAEILPIAAAAVRGMRAAEADVDEVVQRVRARLLVREGKRAPRIADYAGRGDLARWVKATAIRIYLNQIRDERREQPVGDDDMLDELARPELDPELAYLKQRYRAELRAAFADAVGELPDTDKNLIRFRHVDGLTVEEVAAVFRVHRGTAHRWLADVRDRLARRTEQLLRERLALTAAEYDSLCRLVDSQLDWSLSRDLMV
jgi:RNA polymerase sigma-70 factor (ECF subfamily)